MKFHRLIVYWLCYFIIVEGHSVMSCGYAMISILINILNGSISKSKILVSRRGTGSLSVTS